jgi:tetratricopeptide (TPR) repeat protein
LLLPLTLSLLFAVVLSAQTEDLRALMIKGMQLDSQHRFSEAETYYQRALKLAPDSAAVLNNLGNHYLASGDRAQARKFYLRAVAIDPHHTNACLQLAQMSVEEKDGKQALAYLSHLQSSDKPDPDVALLKERALALVRLDLAIERFRQQGGQAALLTLDEMPVADRQGDYYLLRAQILDSLGKTQEAVDALNRGMRAAPTRSDLYLQAAGFLMKHNLLREALNLLEQASGVLPDDRELLLAQVVTMELLRRETDAQSLLSKIQTRWPKWDRAYQLKGILLEIQLKSVEARKALETAIALGANTPEVYYYKALAITHAAPDDLEGAQEAINHALALTSTDSYAFVLAGKIALAKKEYTKAVRYFLEANRLQPTLVPAHYGLRDAYKALGDERKSAAEMDEIKRLARENQAVDQNPFAAEGWMFAVRPPG